MVQDQSAPSLKGASFLFTFFFFFYTSEQVVCVFGCLFSLQWRMHF